MSFSMKKFQKKNSISLIDINDESLFNQITAKWSDLPPTVVEIIYTYLRRTDQINMSLVCKNWSNGFKSPGVWKKMVYNTFNRLSEEADREIEIARKFGCMFRYVEIIDNFPCINANVYRAKERLKTFLGVLISSKCQLLSLTFRSRSDALHIYLERNDETDLVNSIVHFIQTQHALRTLEFHNSLYEKEDAIRILSAVCVGNSRKLKALVLDGFVRDGYEGVPVSPHVFSFFCFTNLRTLKIEYSQFFVENMQSLLNLNDRQIFLIKKLLLIDIECECSRQVTANSISPLVWRRLRLMCSQLRVKMKLNYSFRIQNNFAIYLVDYIPLQHLECKLDQAHEVQNVSIGSLLQQIRYCKGTLDVLESLKIAWMSAMDDISISLLPFLQVAKKLKVLELCFRSRAAGIETVFESLLKNRPESLESVNISVTRFVTRSTRRQMTVIAEKYVPLFLNKGLKVKLSVD